METILSSHWESEGAVDGPPPVADADRRAAAAAFFAKCFLSIHT